MYMRLLPFYAFFCLLSISNQASAQSIFINPDSLPTTAVDKVISYETFFVNGIYTHGLSKKMSKRHVKLGNIRKSLLSFITLRLVSDGKIKLHESISFTLPDIVERNPFRVAVTPHHILTETAGFAVPALVTEAPLARYASHMRTAGQMAHHDSVAWAVLMEFLEAKSGKTIEQLFFEEILEPLGLNSSSIHLPNTDSSLLKFEGMMGSGASIAETARMLIRNRTATGDRFLPTPLFGFMTNVQSWRMHPLTPNHSYGGIFRWSDTQQWLEPAPGDETGPAFMAFPEAGVAFVKITGLTADFRQIVSGIANSLFIPSTQDTRINDTRHLTAYERFSGYYVRTDAPSAWLNHRLRNIYQTQIYIQEAVDGSLKIEQDGHVITFTKHAPFHYKSAAGNVLTLSPFKSGGYLILDEITYRYASILGNKHLVINLFPFVLIILLSSGFYANSKTSKAWRRMGQYGLVGTIMMAAGLLCDFLWWPEALFVWDMPIAVNIWRTVSNIGLMLVVSLPMFALTFVKNNEMPEGMALLYVPFHLALIGCAALAAFLILVAWGAAGEFSAY